MVLHPRVGSGERLSNHRQVLLPGGFVPRDLCWSLDTSQTANCTHAKVNAGITFHSQAPLCLYVYNAFVTIDTSSIEKK